MCNSVFELLITSYQLPPVQIGPLLKLQSCFTRRIGKCLHAAMILETAAIECDLRDACRDGLDRNGLADRSRRGLVAAVLEADSFLIRVGRSDRLARCVVDDLGINMFDAAEDRQPRTFR